MRIRHCLLAVATLVAFTPALAWAQTGPGGDWIKAIFPTTSFDFGTVARGSKVHHSFQLVNNTNSEIHIASHQTKRLKARDGPNSSLQVFCRIDVGILTRAPDTVSYFVNEVERGITTSLWVTDGPYTAGMSGMSIVASLKRWVAAERHRLEAKSN